MQRLKESITKLLDQACPAWGVRAQLGDQPRRPGRPCWLDPALPGSIWLPLAPLLARSGPPGRPGWLDLAALVAPGRPGWLSKAKKRLAFRLSASMLPTSMLPASCDLQCFLMRTNALTIALTTRLTNRFAYRRSCFDAACFVRSATFRHASNLVGAYM